MLEPEAAAIYCTHLPIDKMSSEGAGQQMTVFQKGTRYMVLDAGGTSVTSPFPYFAECGTVPTSDLLIGNDQTRSNMLTEYVIFSRYEYSVMEVHVDRSLFRYFPFFPILSLAYDIIENS